MRAPARFCELPAVGQVVDDEDVVAAARVERVDEVRPDESGPAGDDEHGEVMACGEGECKRAPDSAIRACFDDRAFRASTCSMQGSALLPHPANAVTTVSAVRSPFLIPRRSRKRDPRRIARRAIGASTAASR